MTQTTLVTSTGGLSADLPANTHKVVNLGAPSASTDAATKGYVDATAVGLVPKANVAALVAANVALSALQTIDGVVLIDANRVLLVAQTTGSQNGVWVAHAGAWTRPTDYASGSSQKGAFIAVATGGASYGGSQWVQIDAAAITVDSDSSSWTQFASSGSTQAGSGLQKVGNTISVATGGVTSAMIADATITDTDVAAANKDGAAGTASMRTLGTGATQAAAGNDSRMTDARTPVAHHLSHEVGGGDALTSFVPVPGGGGIGQFLQLTGTGPNTYAFGTPTGGIPLGDIDLTQAPYSIVTGSTGAAAANLTGLNLAISDAAGLKELVWPAGTIYLPNPADPGAPSGTGSIQTYCCSFSGDLYMRGQGRKATNISFVSGYKTGSGGGNPYRQTMFHSTGTNATIRWRNMNFAGPAAMPSPMPGFYRHEAFYNMQVLERSNGGGSLYCDNVTTTGYWTNGFSNQGSTYVNGGKITYQNCDIFAVDQCSTAFTDTSSGSWGPDYQLNGDNTMFRSHEFFTKSFLTGATFSGSTVTVTTDRPHKLIVGDTFRLPNAASIGLTGLVTAAYTVVSVVNPTSFTFTQVGVGGAYTTSSWVLKVTGMEFAISNATFSGSTVTVTTAAPMDLSAGTTSGTEFVFFPDGIPGLTGIAASAYRQTSWNIVSVVDSTHFTITVPGVGGAYTSGGTVALEWTENGLGIYAGVNLDVDLRFCNFYGGNREGIKCFTSSAPATTPSGKKYQLTGCEFYGSGDGFKTANINNVHTNIVGGVFACCGTGISASSLAGSTLSTASVEFAQGQAAILIYQNSPCDVTVVGGHCAAPADPHYTGVATPVFSMLGNNTATVYFKAVGVLMDVNSNNEYLWMPSVATCYADLIGCTLRGGSGRNNILGIVVGGYTHLSGCQYIGAQSTMFDFRNDAGISELVVDDTRFLEASGTFFSNLPTAAGLVRGKGNLFGAHLPSWSTLAKGPLWETRRGQSPTAATSAANTTLSMNHDIEHMTAVAVTVNNLWVGGSANANRCFGGTIKRLIFDGATTVLSNSGGNIRLKSGADVSPAVGETRSFMFDATNDLWREC